MHAAFHEGSASGNPGHASQDRQWRTSCNTTCTGDDDDRDGGSQVTGREPGDDCSEEGCCDDPGGNAIAEPLNRGWAVLVGAHSLDDLAITGVGTNVLDPHLEGASVIDRTCQDTIPSPYCHRHRLSSDPGLVHFGCTSFDESIHGDAVSRGDDDEVPRGHTGQRRLDDPLVASHPDRVGKESHEVGECVTATFHGQVLENLGNEDECGDHECGDPFTDGCGSSDGEQHRQLHTHMGMTQVVEGLSEEGPAPDNEADDANRRKTMARPREPQPRR